MARRDRAPPQLATTRGSVQHARAASVDLFQCEAHHRRVTQAVPRSSRGKARSPRNAAVQSRIHASARQRKGHACLCKNAAERGML